MICISLSCDRPGFKPIYECQKPLIGLSPESFLDYINGVIPEDELCRLVKQVASSLDTVAIEEKYSFLGQRTYHPKLLLSLLFYGYATVTKEEAIEPQLLKGEDRRGIKDDGGREYGKAKPHRSRC